MIRKAAAMNVRHNLGDLLNSVQYKQDSVLITKGGKPVAALIDIHLFEKFRSLEEEFDRLLAQLRQTYKGVKPKIAEGEIAEAIAAARQK